MSLSKTSFASKRHSNAGLQYTTQFIDVSDNGTENRKDCIKEDTDPTKNRSTCCTKLCLVACSIPTVSNMLDACCSALFMSNKDMSFGLWLNQTHGYDQLNIARRTVDAKCSVVNYR